MFIHTKEIAQEVKEYNRQNFSAWKAAQGDNYVAAISNLRWHIDFKKDLDVNLAKIEDWLASTE